MKINLNDVLLFGVIVKEGSLKNASLKLNIPISTVSRRLKELELRIHKKLLNRDNKCLQLTPFGEVLFSECCQQLLCIDEKINSCIDIDSDMSGVITLSAPQELYQYLYHKKILDFQNRFPEIILNITFVSKDSPQRKIKDIIICSNTQPYQELIQKKVSTVDLLLCASPGYFSSTKLVMPEDIRQYKTITVPPYECWTFSQKGRDENKEFIPKSSFYVDTFELAKKMVLEGAGLALLPAPLVEKELRERSLIHCLPDWESARISHYLLYANKDRIPLRVQTLIRWLTQDK